MKESFVQKLMRFMQGRYGNDQLSRFMTIISFIVLLISIFSGQRWLSLVFLLLIVIIYFRMFSKKVDKRYRENQLYLKLTSKFRVRFQKLKTKAKQNKNYKVFKCPNCDQKLRVPRGRGNIIVTCKKCDHKFNKKS